MQSKMEGENLSPTSLKPLMVEVNLDEMRRKIAEIRGLKFYKKEDLRNGMPDLIMASYPRTGSHLLKTVLEEVTGHFMGSDINACFRPSHWMINRGTYLGSLEGVKLFKTHYPMGRIPFRLEGDSKGRKVLVVYRDFIPSFISLINRDVFKGLQDLKMNQEQLMERKEVIRSAVPYFLKKFQNFHEYWVNQPTVPVLFVDFQDLFESPQEFIKEIIDFLELNSDVIPEKLEKIKDGETVKNMGVYKPKVHTPSNTPLNFEEVFGEDLFKKASEINQNIRRLVFGDDKKKRRILNENAKADEWWIVPGATNEKDEEIDVIFKELNKYLIDA